MHTSHAAVAHGTRIGALVTLTIGISMVVWGAKILRSISI